MTTSRIRRLGLCATLALALCGQSALAAVTLKHAPQDKEGDKVRVQREVDLAQTLKLGGMDIDTANQSFMVVEETVTKVDPNGDRTKTGKFEAFQSTITFPGAKFQFDSGNPTTEAPIPQLQPLADLFKALSAATWTSVNGPDGTTKEITFDGDPFANLGEDLKKEVSSESMIKEQNNELKKYHDEPVNVGDTWERTEEMNAGSGQILRFKKKYEYLGEETEGDRTLDRVGVTFLTIDYEANFGPSLPLELKESDLKIESSEGTLLYDRAEGRYTSIDEKVRIVGTLKFKINEQELPGELDLKISSKSNVQQ